MAEPTPKQLHQFILDCFNDDDLDLFCLEYFGDALHSFGSGMSRSKRALELVTFCQRRAVMDSLLAALQKEREKVYRERFATQPGKRVALPPVYTPQPRNPKQIFVSHSSVDADLAHQIAGDLQANGYDIFITPDSIRPGEKWVPAIGRGLEESGIFLLLLTPHAVQSGWVNDEMNSAIALAHENEMQVLLLDVQECRPPVFWKQRQLLSFRGEDYRRNMGALLQALGGGRPTPPLPAAPPAQREPSPVENLKADTEVRQCEGQTSTGRRCRNLALTGKQLLWYSQRQTGNKNQAATRQPAQTNEPTNPTACCQTGEAGGRTGWGSRAGGQSRRAIPAIVTGPGAE